MAREVKLMNGAGPFSGITVFGELITPMKAADWLKKSADFRNRNLMRARVRRYASAMADERWMINGETIIFDTNGMLCNGQHRLRACVESGRAFYSLVVRGIEPEAFASLDAGFARTGGNVLFTQGVENHNQVAGALGLLHEWRRNRLAGGTERPDNQVILSLYKQHPEIRDSVRFVRCCSTVSTRYSVMAFCHFICSEADKLESDRFFTALGSGESLRSGDPVYALRERLIALKAESAGGRSHIRHTVLIYFVLRAFKAHMIGERLGRLSMPRSGILKETLDSVDPARWSRDTGAENE